MGASDGVRGEERERVDDWRMLCRGECVTGSVGKGAAKVHLSSIVYLKFF